MTTITQDLERIVSQEKSLVFSHFDNATAWILGASIHEMCTAKKVSVAIEIRLSCETVFFMLCLALPLLTLTGRGANAIQSSCCIAVLMELDYRFKSKVAH